MTNENETTPTKTENKKGGLNGKFVRKHRGTLTAVFAGLALAGSTPDALAGNKTGNQRAGVSGNMNINAGRVVRVKTSNDWVREYAERKEGVIQSAESMVEETGKTYDDLLAFQQKSLQDEISSYDTLIKASSDPVERATYVRLRASRQKELRDVTTKLTQTKVSAVQQAQARAGREISAAQRDEDNAKRRSDNAKVSVAGGTNLKTFFGATLNQSSNSRTSSYGNNKSSSSRNSSSTSSKKPSPGRSLRSIPVKIKGR